MRVCGCAYVYVCACLHWVYVCRYVCTYVCICTCIYEFVSRCAYQDHVYTYSIVARWGWEWMPLLGLYPVHGAELLPKSFYP